MNKFNPRLCYIYARKSSEGDEKQVESIPRQIDIALELAKRDGITIPKDHIITEKKSAKIPGRPKFIDLINIVELSSHTVIYCWLFNRLSRNSKEDGWVRHLIETGKLTIITSKEIFDESTNSIVTAVEGAKATQDSRDIGRMVTDANNRRRNQGTSPGQPPPGYKWGGERGRMKHVPDKHRWQLINDALHLVLNRTEPTDALNILNDEWQYRSRKKPKLGGGPLAKATWYEIVLKNPYYFGQFIAFKNTPQEKWIPGNHKPMITEDEFWQIQSILGEVGRQRPRIKGENQAAFLKLIDCGQCDKNMQHDTKKQLLCDCGYKYSTKNRNICKNCGLHKSKAKKKEQSYDFYECRTKGCPQSIFHTEQIELVLAQQLDQLTIPQEFIDWAMEYLETQVDEEVISQEAQLEALNHADEENEQELRRLNQLYVKGGYDYEGGEAEYKQQQQELLKKRATIRRQKAEFTNYADDWRDKTENGYRFCRDAATIFRGSKASHRTKRDIFTSLCEKATVMGDKLILDIEPPFKVIKKSLDKIKRKYQLTEPEKIDELLGDTTNSELIEGIKLTWLPIRDDFRTLNWGELYPQPVICIKQMQALLAFA